MLHKNCLLEKPLNIDLLVGKENYKVINTWKKLIKKILTNHKIKINLLVFSSDYFKRLKKADLGIVYLPQEPSIFRALSVFDNVKSALELRKINKKDLNHKTEEILQDFDIKSIALQKGNELSGGQRRRVEIARSIALNPKFIMLDEPFAGIDPIAIQELKKLIEKLSKKGLGILISDHNVKATMDICEEIFVINQGSIISKGTPEEVSQNEIVKRTYLGE